MTEPVLDELEARGLLALCTDRTALEAELRSGPVTFYVGFDPTAPSLHIGNLVQLIVASRLQRAGHRALILVGGATGMIGDPKATGERRLNDKETVAGWVDRVRDQVSRYVDTSGPNAARVVDNLEWTGDLGVLDFLRDVGKHFPVNRMLGREVVRARLEDGISYTEFSYVLLQAMDYLQLYRSYGCRLQTGGSDQWGNLTAGVELIRRAEHTQVHALATPLVTKADGSKFGKTESGTVWLDAELTSPYAFHQFWLNAEDAKVATYLDLFSDRPHSELTALLERSAADPKARLAQRVLAADVTTLVHGADEAKAAEAAAVALFGGGALEEVPAAMLTAALTETPHAVVPDEGPLPTIVEALVTTGLTPSRSAARRAVAEGGAYLNNYRVTDPEYSLRRQDVLPGGWCVVRRGKRTVAGLRFASR